MSDARESAARSAVCCHSHVRLPLLAPATHGQNGANPPSVSSALSGIAIQTRPASDNAVCTLPLQGREVCSTTDDCPSQIRAAVRINGQKTRRVEPHLTGGGPCRKASTAAWLSLGAIGLAIALSMLCWHSAAADVHSRAPESKLR